MRKIVALGATSLIAQETLKNFAKDKDSFFLIGRNEEKLNEVAKNLEVLGASEVNVKVVKDVCDFKAHQEIINEADKMLSNFDNFFVFYGVLGNQKEMEEDFSKAKELLDVNFISVASFVSIVANKFEKEKRGNIAVISSVAGDRGRQSNYFYGASKGGLSVFLEGLRNRLSFSNVNVLTVKPGFVATPMTAHREKGLLFASADYVGKTIYKAVKKNKNVLYTPCFWWGIMFIVKHIPECILKKMKM